MPSQQTVIPLPSTPSGHFPVGVGTGLVDDKVVVVGVAVVGAQTPALLVLVSAVVLAQ